MSISAHIFTLRPRGLLRLLPLLIGSFASMLLLSIYYLPTAENAVSYFGFRHGTSWDLAHGVSAPSLTTTATTASTSSPQELSANDSTAWASHLSAVSASMLAARPHATGSGHGHGHGHSHGNANVNIPPTGPACQLVEGADSILVIMKTSTLSISAKLPTQLTTVLSCVPNVLLVSDVAQEFHGHHVHNVLGEVDRRYRDGEAEFEWLRAVRGYRDSGLEEDLLGVRNNEVMGMRLRRWMDVPALRLAGEKWPGVEWYVVVDAGMYLSFPSLLEVVAELDANVPLYTGDGGSGYLISRGAARLFEEEFGKGGKERWEEGIVGAEAGVGMLELSMRESGVAFKSLPHGKVLQDNSMESFGGWESMWCRPAVSWQHMGSAEVEQIWKWERHFLETKETAMITFKDVFEGLIEPRIRKGHEAGWENDAASKVLLPLRSNSTDDERRAWEGLEKLDLDPTLSWDACEKACQVDRGCLSWQFGPGRCNLGSSVILGRKTEGEVKEHGLAISGWNMKRIKRWKERMGPCT